MTQEIRFNYESFFNTLEKREENKIRVKFWNNARKKPLNCEGYTYINGVVCYDENESL